MNSKLSAIFFIIFIITLPAYAQRPPLPYLKAVTIRCTTMNDRSNGMFYYTYEISNGTSSSGNLGGFNIDISKVDHEISYDTVGLKYQDDGFTEGAFRRHYPALAGKVVPVGFPVTPVTWIASLSDDFTAAFFGDSLINPGKSLGGFVMMSRGLPGIRSFFASPDFDPTKYFADPDVYPDSAMNMDSVNHALNYYGWTIGPTAPPLDFSASSWIDTLISYKHQSVTLGWLTNGPQHEKDEDDDKSDEGIVERLDRRLDKAKAALAKSDSVKARLELELFVKEVEDVYHQNKEEGKRLGVPVLTSEGYALLKYNAEYLIDRLPERSRR